ncbi:MAG: tetratricopeptide repeat protein [Elusimicrobiota bacterium]|nr:tetratricopeptide repeat protein [Elusimicrobiota bacterium]
MRARLIGVSTIALLACTVVSLGSKRASSQADEGATALVRLKQAVERDASDPRARLELARALLALRRFKEADVHAQRAAALAPDDLAAFELRCRLDIAMGRYAAILARCRPALRTHPGNQPLRYASAMALYCFERYEEALEVLGPPSAEDSYDIAHMRTNTLLNLRRGPEALAAVERELAIRDYDYPRLSRAEALLLVGRHDEAMLAARPYAYEALTGHAHSVMGYAARDAGDVKAAVEHMAQAVRYYESDANHQRPGRRCGPDLVGRLRAEIARLRKKQKLRRV